MLSATIVAAACASALLAAPPPVEAVRPPVEVRLTSGVDSCRLTVVHRPDGDRVRATARGGVVAEAARLRVIDPTPNRGRPEFAYEVATERGRVRLSNRNAAFTAAEVSVKRGGRIMVTRPAVARR